jgi:hypothetical protein
MTLWPQDWKVWQTEWNRERKRFPYTFIHIIGDMHTGQAIITLKINNNANNAGNNNIIMVMPLLLSILSSAKLDSLGKRKRIVQSQHSLLFPWTVPSNLTSTTSCRCENQRPTTNDDGSGQRQYVAEQQEQCSVCMYTGVAVCTGLSLYFVKLATDDTTLSKNRRFLWVCSAGWAVTGFYRWYLG